MLGAHFRARFSAHDDPGIVLLDAQDCAVAEQFAITRLDTASQTPEIFGGMKRGLVGIAQAARLLVAAQRNPPRIGHGHPGLLGGLGLVLDFGLTRLTPWKQEPVDAAKIARDAFRLLDG